VYAGRTSFVPRQSALKTHRKCWIFFFSFNKKIQMRTFKKGPRKTCTKLGPVWDATIEDNLVPKYQERFKRSVRKKDTVQRAVTNPERKFFHNTFIWPPWLVDRLIGWHGVLPRAWYSKCGRISLHGHNVCWSRSFVTFLNKKSLKNTSTSAGPPPCTFEVVFSMRFDRK